MHDGKLFKENSRGNAIPLIRQGNKLNSGALANLHSSVTVQKYRGERIRTAAKRILHNNSGITF